MVACVASWDHVPETLQPGLRGIVAGAHPPLCRVDQRPLETGHFASPQQVPGLAAEVQPAGGRPAAERHVWLPRRHPAQPHAEPRNRGRAPLHRNSRARATGLRRSHRPRKAMACESSRVIVNQLKLHIRALSRDRSYKLFPARAHGIEPGRLWDTDLMRRKQLVPHLGCAGLFLHGCSSIATGVRMAATSLVLAWRCQERRTASSSHSSRLSSTMSRRAGECRRAG